MTQLQPVGNRGEMFCTSMPNMQKVWDATSLGLLLTCPRKWYQTIVLGYQKDPMPPALWFGIMVHRGVETMLKEKAKGNERYLQVAIRTVLEESEGYVSDDTARTRTTLVRTLVWYDEQFKDDSARVITDSNGEALAEQSFRFPLPIKSPDGDDYIICGHLDAVVEFMGDLYIMEHKHSTYVLNDKYFQRYTPNTQVSVYSLAGRTLMERQIKGVLINAIQVGVGFNRFMRRPANRSSAYLDEWLKEVCFAIKNAERYAEAQLWPAHDQVCGLFGGCTFIEACAKPPTMRETWLKSQFAVKPWNPLENR